MIDWLVIGGGIHGTYLSNLLTDEGNLSPDDIRVLDPHDRPLAVWDRQTAGCGMRYLRSPATHHIDLKILSLYHYAKTFSDPLPPFIPPYNRPSLRLFRSHCRQVIRIRKLDRLRLKGRAKRLIRDRSRVVVETEGERLTARRIILAIGLTEQPRWPDWARRLKGTDRAVCHVFDPDFSMDTLDEADHTIILGGGPTAVQTALAMREKIMGRITVVSSHNLRRSNFDFDPCWIGPKCLTGFLRIPASDRAGIIDRERLTGTLPEEVFADMTEALSRNRLSFHRGTVTQVSRCKGRLRLKLDSGSLDADRVVLATGFDPKRPGGRLVDQAIDTFGLKTDTGGYPVIGDDLRWGENLYVSGPLAQLRIGPCARNIVGARNAGRLLARQL